MKSLFFVAVLVALCGESAVNVQADVIECRFPYASYYTCIVKSIKQDGNQNVITRNHEEGKSDSDFTNVYYWSKSNFINLTNFDSIFCQEFPNLESIHFEMVMLVNLVENALHGCQHLNLFKLKHADIKQIPDNFFSNNLNLTYIDLSRNRLETLPQNVFQPLTKLKILWLEYNNLSTLSPGLFDNLKNLETLDLNDNKIKDLPKGIFVGLEKLKTLKIDENNLVTIHADSFGKKPQLTFVNLSNNPITSIDEKFIDNTAVSNLYLDEDYNYSEEEMEARDKIKEKLKQYFNNYQPRQDEAQK